MTTKFYLDTRCADGEKPLPVKISLTSKGKTAYFNTNFSLPPSQWDPKAEKAVNHPYRLQINTALTKRKLDIDTALIELQGKGRLHGLTAYEIKEAVTAYLDPERADSLFMPRLEAYSERVMAETTKYTYTHTADKIRGFCKNAERLRFEDITPKWLEKFNVWMAEAAPSQNARNIILRNIRTIFNDALDDGVTTYYPFRKFKIKAEPTKSRALTADQVRALFSFDGVYVDMFKLSFYLGGISFCDLCALTPKNLVAGRVEYRRIKTGQFCSVGIQPEAQELMDKYKGRKHLVFVAEEGDYRTFLHNMNCALKRKGQTYNPKTKVWDGDAVCSSASQYWARYTVATLAAENGASEETIGAMLGHSSNTSVTSIYTRANRNKQVDEALRSVIDTIGKE